MDGGDFKSLVDVFDEMRHSFWLGMAATFAGLLVFALGFIATFCRAGESKYELMAIGAVVACIGFASFMEYSARPKVSKDDLNLAMAETLKSLDDNKKRIVRATYEDGFYRSNATNLNVIELVKAGILNPPPAMTMYVEGIFTLNNRWRTFIDGNASAIYDGNAQS